MSTPPTGGKTWKSSLNELAQKNKLSQPTYQTVDTHGGFDCTVTFNGRQFKVSNKFPHTQSKAIIKLSLLVVL